MSSPPELIAVKDVTLMTKKIAGVIVPVLNEIQFEIGHYSLFNSPPGLPMVSNC